MYSSKTNIMVASLVFSIRFLGDKISGHSKLIWLVPYLSPMFLGMAA
jgi:hypothetical protein